MPRPARPIAPPDAALPATGFFITRESLGNGSLPAAIRASAPPGMVLRSDAELAESLETALQGHDPADDVHVFGYGSLMWNPAFHYADSVPASVRGWRRRFCVWLYMARGTPETPGLMLALDRGGACRGMSFRIPAPKVREELALLWQREMLTGTYQARWVMAMAGEKPVRALTFVVNRAHTRYAGSLSDDQAAHFILTGRGGLGTCADYFERTLTALEGLGIQDAGIERLRRAMSAR